MVQRIQIENYKSVQSLDIELGRLNVFIGANGCGKTNILEAIALGSAAAADKLDHEFLGSRGIRMTEPKWMKSGFNNNYISKSIKIDFLRQNDLHHTYEVNYKDGVTPKFFLEKDTFKEHFKSVVHDLEVFVDKTFEKKPQRVTVGKEKITREDIEDEKLDQIKQLLLEQLEKTFEIESLFIDLPKILNFLVFSPENYFLRRFEEESYIKPLGIRGEGLFSHLVELIQKPEIFNQIKTHLQLMDWFDDFEVPNDLYFNQRKITIKDRFLAEGLQYFDQRSANEGFLYLLFYTTLFISPYTPKFFAIDNIDNSLNPKLCSELTKLLAQLAKDHDKQAILTTHNPAVLDGLNLNDDEQRLFVIYRNADGHTKANRIFKKELPEGMKPVKLSEQFLRGYLGGLNENF